ncbi:MAG TPA: LacI family DNA-binding transcriptional regulator [Methylomirabilota bacterium]|jgi:DNA-binding LacI/PurR family transcriptional regulator
MTVSLKKKRATIRDVGRRALVSHQTVSRVINGEPSIAPATRARRACHRRARLPSQQTTVRVPRHELGRAAAAILLDLMAGRAAREPGPLPLQLIRRQSCRRIGRSPKGNDHE